MKKLLSGIVAIVVLMALATNVKAATMGAAKTVEQGGTITVTINVSPRESVGFGLKYDTDRVTYVSANSGSALNDASEENGVVTVGGIGGTTSAVTFTFKAKDNAKGKAIFTVVDNTTSGESTPAPVEVEIVEKSTGSGEGIGNEGTGSTTEGTQSGTKKEEKVNDQGVVIKKLPKTGVSYVTVAGLVLAVTGSVVIARKISK